MILTLVLLLFVAATVLVSIEVSALRSASAKVRNKYDPALLNSQSLLASYVNQETGERGYLITGEMSFLEPYTSGEATLTRAIGRLTTLLEGEPHLQELFRDAIAAGDDWHRSVQPELAARRANDEQRADQLVLAGTSKATFDTLRTRLSTLQTAVSSRRTRALDTQSRDTETLIIALIVAASTALAAVLVLVLASRRWVLRPIAGLGTALHDVHAGSLDSPVAVVGPSEFRALAGDADAMRQRLVQEIEVASRATEGLAQQAPVVLDIRAALAADGVPMPGLDLFGVVATAEGELAGDWWELVTIGPARQILIIADVSGHGAPAGLLAVRLKSVVLAALSLGTPPQEVIRTAATQVFAACPDKFATLALLDIDLAEGTVAWTNAGHPGPLLITADGSIRTLDATGSLVNPIADAWTTESAPFRPGDLLVAYSDGLSEARDGDSTEFGLARIADAIAADAGAEQVVTGVLAALAGHSDTRRQLDDVTLVAVRRVGP
jgi:CHASE3 domain sensor protein